MDEWQWYILPIWVKCAGDENPDEMIRRFNEELKEKMNEIAERMTQESSCSLQIEWTVNKKISPLGGEDDG